MDKKTIVAISLVSAVISLAYMLLNYFGIIRYTGMYLFSTENYTKNYSKLDQVDKDKRVVVSLTATDKELKNIAPVIKSLLDQTVKVNLISVVVPYGKKYKLPSNLKNVVSVYRTGINYGDLNAVIPTVIREGEASTQIIALGADKIYGKDFIEELLESAKKNPEQIIYCNNKGDDICIRKGVLFPINIFTEEFVNAPKNKSSHDWVNDFFRGQKKTKIEYSENYRKI